MAQSNRGQKFPAETRSEEESPIAMMVAARPAYQSAHPLRPVFVRGVQNPCGILAGVVDTRIGLEGGQRETRVLDMEYP
jgi:hypothetical protein